MSLDLLYTKIPLGSYEKNYFKVNFYKCLDKDTLVYHKESFEPKGSGA